MYDILFGQENRISLAMDTLTHGHPKQITICSNFCKWKNQGNELTPKNPKITWLFNIQLSRFIKISLGKTCLQSEVKKFCPGINVSMEYYESLA